MFNTSSTTVRVLYKGTIFFTKIKTYRDGFYFFKDLSMTQIQRLNFTSCPTETLKTTNLVILMRHKYRYTLRLKL
jgi:hypothetical protein